MKKLMVVDDEQRIINQIARIVKKYDIEFSSISESSNFSEALQNFKPDIIFLDINMPGTDGIQLLSYLSETNNQSVVYLISGMAPQILNSTRIIAEQQDCNIAGIISKPFTEADIHKILDANNIDMQPFSGPKHISSNDKPTEDDLKQAIRNQEIRVVYQPKMSLKTNNIVGVEVLARWQSNRFGDVPPSQFVALAEEKGLIHQLTWYIILEMLKDYRTLNTLAENLKISLNISPALFYENGFADDLVDLFADFKADTSNFILEITETIDSDKFPEFLKSMTRLRVKGFELSLDDFGTGNSSTLKLFYLPITELKLDKKFIQRLADNEQARIIVKSTIDLAKSYQVAITAEGVEDANTLFWLKENGCDIGQGYCISKAMDIVTLTNFINRDELDKVMEKLYESNSADKS